MSFGKLREQVGLHEETVTVVTSTPTVADLLTELTARGAEWQEALESTEPLPIAVDKQMAQPTTGLPSNCEVAFFRSVTGG